MRDGRGTDGRTDEVKPIYPQYIYNYPPQTTSLCGGYNYVTEHALITPTPGPGDST